MYNVIRSFFPITRSISSFRFGPLQVRDEDHTGDHMQPQFYRLQLFRAGRQIPRITSSGEQYCTNHELDYAMTTQRRSLAETTAASCPT